MYTYQIDFLVKMCYSLIVLRSTKTENVGRSRVVRVINNPECEMLVAPGWCEV